MFAPDDIDYTRIDVSALLQSRGIAVIEELRQAPCKRWLARHDYDLAFVDFAPPFKVILAQLGAMFDWVDQFGYSFEEGEGNLDALADGFSFPISAQRGHVLIVSNPDALATAEPACSGMIYR